MTFINYAAKEINCKIVYYGPGLGGKTTNLQYIYSKTSPDAKGKMISLATETDRTLFFDFLPLDLGTIRGFTTRFHLYTVPGQVFYDASRKLILKGADGVIFVADSQEERMESNIESIRNLEANLKQHGLDLMSLPYALQFNKRDLANAMPVDELYRVLNFKREPTFEAVAPNGRGVFDTLKSVAKQILVELRKRGRRLRRPAARAAAAAPTPTPRRRPSRLRPVLQPEDDMDKLWSKTEISHLKRYAEQQSLEELAQRFHTDTESVRRKMTELGIAGGAPESEQADAYIVLLGEALQALNAKKWAEAEAMFDRLIVESDHQHLAERSRQYKAICRQRLAEARPVEDPFLEAVYLKNKGDVDGAMKLAQKHGKSDDEAWAFLTAGLHALSGRDDEALALLGKAIELNPKNRVQAYHDPDLHSLRGRDGFTNLLRVRA